MTSSVTSFATSFRSLVLLLVWAAALPGQITIQVTTATPYGMSTTLQGTTNTVQELTGVAPIHVSRTVGVQGVTAAGFGWDVFPLPTGAETGVEFTTFLNLSVLSPTGSATKPTSDLLVILSAAAPTRVRIEVERNVGLAGAGQLPQFDYDFGNDGIVDFTSGSPLGSLPFSIGPQGLVVRLQTAATLLQQGTVQYWTRLRVLPDSRLTVAESPFGCSSVDMFVSPMFENSGGDVSWIGLFAPTMPQFAVVGFQLLPTALPLPPACVLFPTPDVIFPLSPTGAIPLAIPAVLRPASFWTQSVTVQGNSLLTGPLFLVDAF